MTPEQRIARAKRAEAAWNEFFQPMLDELKAAYSERLVEIANTELHPTNRADKITALSNAIKVVGTLEAGMKEAVRDGEVASADMLRAERIEQLSDAQQRLLKITGY